MREFSVAELELLNKNEVTPEEADAILTMFPQNLDTAIGHIVGLRAGRGQERSEPFTPPEATPSEEAADPTKPSPTGV